MAEEQKNRASIQGIMADGLKTWEDVERAAMNSAVLHQMVTYSRYPELTREKVLIQTVLWLSARLDALQAEAVERLANIRPHAG